MTTAQPTSSKCAAAAQQPVNFPSNIVQYYDVDANKVLTVTKVEFIQMTSKNRLYYSQLLSFACENRKLHHDGVKNSVPITAQNIKFWNNESERLDIFPNNRLVELSKPNRTFIATMLSVAKKNRQQLHFKQTLSPQDLEIQRLEEMVLALNNRLDTMKQERIGEAKKPGPLVIPPGMDLAALVVNTAMKKAFDIGCSCIHCVEPNRWQWALWKALHRRTLEEQKCIFGVFYANNPCPSKSNPSEEDILRDWVSFLLNSNGARKRFAVTLSSIETDCMSDGVINQGIFAVLTGVDTDGLNNMSNRANNVLDGLETIVSRMVRATDADHLLNDGNIATVISIVLQLVQMMKDPTALLGGSIAFSVASLFGTSTSIIKSAIELIVQYFRPQVQINNGGVNNQGMEVGMLPIVSAVGMLLALSVPSATATKRVVEAIRLAGPLSKLMESGSCLMTKLIEFVPVCVKAWICELFPSFRTIDFMTRDDVLAFILRSNDYEQAGWATCETTNYAAKSALLKDMALGHALYDEALSLYGEKNMPLAFTRAIRTVNTVGGKIKAIFSRGVGAQMCPFWLFLSGPSNIGKSTIADDIAFVFFGMEVMSTIPHAPGESDEDWFERASKLARVRNVYPRAIGMKHWDGFGGRSIGQHVIRYDDYGQSDPSITGVPEATELFQICTVGTAPLPMADLPDKGMICDVDMVMTSSNGRMKEFKEITNQDALRRRRNYTVELTIDPAKGKWMTTKAGGDGHWVYNPEYIGGKYDQYLFQRHDSLTDVKIGEELRWPEFIASLKECYILHTERQAHSLVLPNELIELAMNTSGHIGDRVPKARCTIPESVHAVMANRPEPYYTAPVGNALPSLTDGRAAAIARMAVALDTAVSNEGAGDEYLQTVNDQSDDIEDEDLYRRRLDDLANMHRGMQKPTIFEKIKQVMAMSKDKIVALYGTMALKFVEQFAKIDTKLLFVLGLATGTMAGIFKMAWYHYHPSKLSAAIAGKFMQGDLFSREAILSAGKKNLFAIAKQECDDLLQKVLEKNEDLYHDLYHYLGDLDDMSYREMENCGPTTYNPEGRRRPVRAGRVAQRNGKPTRDQMVNQAFFELDVATSGETQKYKEARKEAEEMREQGVVPTFIANGLKKIGKKRMANMDPMLVLYHYNRQTFFDKIFCIDRDFYYRVITYLNNRLDFDEVDQEHHRVRLTWLTEVGYPEALRGFLPDDEGLYPGQIAAAECQGVLRMPATNFKEQLADYLAGFYKNIVHIGIGDQPELNGVFGVGIVGNLMVTVNHLMENIADGTKITIQKGHQNYPIIYEKAMKYQIPGKDLAFLRLPGLVVPTFKDFRGRVQTEEDLWRFNKREAVMLSYNTLDRTAFYQQMVGKSVRSTEKDYIKGRFPDKDGNIVYNMNSVAYISQVRGVAGSCGLPGISMEPTDERRLMFIHVGGRGDYSVGVAITREDVAEAVLALKPNVNFDIDSELYYANPSRIPHRQAPPQYDVVGKAIVTGFSSDKSVFSESAIYGMVAEPIKEPALLAASDPRCQIENWDPLYQGMEKYSHDSFPVLQSLVDRVGDSIAEIILPIFDSNHARIWTWQEALNGIEQDPIAKAVTLAASAGSPFRYHCQGHRGKYAFINMWDKEGQVTYDSKEMTSCTLKPELERALNAQDAVLRLGGVINHPFNDSAKHELRLKQKIVEGKTRHFMAGALDSLLLNRRYFGAFVTSFFKSHNESYFAPGLDAESPEFDVLARYLLRPGNGMFAGDLSAMDGNVLNPFLDMSVDVINKWYALHHQGSEADLVTDNMVRKSLIEANLHAVSICDDAVVQKHTGNSSGNYLTTIVNSITLVGYYKYLFEKLAMLHAPDMALRHFDEFCALKVYGDDSVLSIGPEVADWYNGKTICEAALLYLGQTFTSATKGAEIVELVPLEECEFLKRQFVYNTKWCQWVGAYRQGELASMVDWVRKSDDPIEQLGLNIEEALEQAVVHGEGFFRDFRGRIVEALQKRRLRIQPVDFAEAHYAYYVRHHPDENRHVIRASLGLKPGNLDESLGSPVLA